MKSMIAMHLNIMNMISAVEQLAIEFSRAGADVTQTFSFWCHEDSLPKGCKFTVRQYSTRIAFSLSV